MNVTINAQNFRVSETLEEFTRKKLSKLDRYLPNIAEIWVDLARQHTKRGEDLAIAQITLRHKRGAILRAEEKLQSDAYDSLQVAVNLAVDKMYRQIERFKGKRRRNHKDRERYGATVEELEAAEEIPQPEEETAEVPAADIDYEEAEIVRRKDITVTAMNEAEAVEQMELLGHNFFVFFNAATGSVNVLYRRNEGGYGVLVPQLG